MPDWRTKIKELPARLNDWACERPRLGWYLVLFLSLNWAVDIGQIVSHIAR